MMKKANNEVRLAAKEATVPMWAVAERLGVSEPTWTRRLRHEFSDAEREKILAIIRDISEENE